MPAVISTLAFLAVVLAVGIGLEFVTSLRRRPRLTAYVEAQGLRLRQCRYSPRLTRPWFGSAIPFKVEVEDQSGHVSEGTAWVSGRIRQRVEIDWD